MFMQASHMVRRWSSTIYDMRKTVCIFIYIHIFVRLHCLVRLNVTIIRKHATKIAKNRCYLRKLQMWSNTMTLQSTTFRFGSGTIEHHYPRAFPLNIRPLNIHFKYRINRCTIENVHRYQLTRWNEDESTYSLKLLYQSQYIFTRLRLPHRLRTRQKHVLDYRSV